jgi:hypothetical protein
VFGFGLSTTLADLLYVVRRPGLLVRSLLSVLVIMPILAVSLVEFLNLRTEVEATLICLAISPVPPLLPKKQRKAGGRQSFGLGLMVILLLAAIPAIPLSVRLLEFFFARPFVVGTGAIARVVLSMVLLPLAMGLMVRSVRISDERDRPFRDGDRRFRQRDRSFRERDRADRKAGLALRMTSTTRAMLAGFCRREHARAPDEHAHDQGRFTT